MPSAQYTSIFDQVITWTNKPSLVAETNIAIRNAIRTAHKSGKFWRDLVTVSITGVPIAEVQQIDLSAYPDFRQLATLESPIARMEPVDVLDLYDLDGYKKQNVCWGLGTTLNVRAATPSDTFTLEYFKYPVVNPIEDVATWICDQHEDLIVLWAAATVLTTLGEQEIKARVERLAAMALQDLQSDAIEIWGR